MRSPFLRSQFESGTLLNYFLIILKDTPVEPRMGLEPGEVIVGNHFGRVVRDSGMQEY